jgi:small subunit ribosomal protein S17
MTGIITSNKMKNAVIVTVFSIKTHDKYKRKFKSRKKYFAACDTVLNLGEEVKIVPTRPISKNICWKVKLK